MGALNKLNSLRSLRISTYPNIHNFNIPKILEDVENLRELCIVSFKIKFAPALCLPCPNERFATQLVTTYPIEWLLLHIGMFFVFHEKMLRCLIKSITTIRYRIFIFKVGGELRSMFEIPGI